MNRVQNFDAGVDLCRTMSCGAVYGLSDLVAVCPALVERQEGSREHGSGVRCHREPVRPESWAAILVPLTLASIKS